MSLPEDGLVIYALQPKQHEVYRLTPLYRPRGEPYPTYIGYGGAAFGGKSYCSRVILTAAALRWPGSTGILFRKTEREVVANHVNKFKSEVPAVIGGRELYRYNANDLLVTWANGSRTYFGYLRNDDDVFAYQGPEYDYMIFEEATHYSFWQVSWLTANRLRATIPGSRPFAFFPSNPGGQGHFWYKRWFVDKNYHEADGERAEDFAFVQARYEDNPEGLSRDPAYPKRLERLPEPWRSWLKNGDFSAGAGTALADIDHSVHLVKPFPVPAHWPVYGAFDWGYNHPFSFGFYAVSEDGDRYKLDTVTGRHLLPEAIAERVRSRMQRLGITRLDYTVAGRDAWAEIRARGESTPTIADVFGEMGLPLVQANIDRRMGLQELRRLLAWKHTGANGGPGQPRLRFFDTEGNRKCLEQLETRVTDPDDSEDVLKTDADDWGDGGDDMYDETRYAVALRSPSAPDDYGRDAVRAWDPSVLSAERDRLLRRRPDARASGRSALDNDWEVN